MKIIYVITFILLNLVLSSSLQSSQFIDYKINKDIRHEYIKNILSKVSNHPENDKIAKIIGKNANELKIDPKIMMAIIKVESDFNQKAVSRTGDISMAQINLKVWNKEFKRLKLGKIDRKLLKKDYEYSIKIMSQILNIIKQRHNNDPYWYARYHSNNQKSKNVYAKKMQKNIDIMNKSIIGNYFNLL
jgi:soluble lytic murein transglycosylase-like protein